MMWRRIFLERQEKIMENNDFLQDLKTYIQYVMDKDKIKAQILYFSIFKEYSDNEISNLLDISRQYVNRMKKNLIVDFLEKQK